MALTVALKTALTMRRGRVRPVRSRPSRRCRVLRRKFRWGCDGDSGLRCAGPAGRMAVAPRFEAVASIERSEMRDAHASCTRISLTLNPGYGCRVVEMAMTRELDSEMGLWRWNCAGGPARRRRELREPEFRQRLR
jgi:hypothetical protein